MAITEFSLESYNDINPIALCQAGDMWEQVIDSQIYVPTDYLRAMVEYQSAYVNANAERMANLHAVLIYQDTPIAIWPLNLQFQGGAWETGSNAGGVIPPLLVSGATRRQKKAVFNYAFSEIDRLGRETGQSTWNGEEFMNKDSVSDWHRGIMNRGGCLSAHHNLFVDLEPDLTKIKENFRRSYKHLISKSKKYWRAEVIENNASDAIETFRALHIAVAGRETRPKATWDLQGKAVEQGRAFIVFLRDTEDTLVGAGLFYHSNHEGIYAVAAFDRSQFDKPVGHLVQMTAINHMKALGLKWYRVGYRPYPGDQPEPNEKELNIGLFKEGFSSHSRLVLRTCCPISYDTDQP